VERISVHRLTYAQQRAGQGADGAALPQAAAAASPGTPAATFA
jgi:hypothetical protein